VGLVRKHANPRDLRDHGKNARKAQALAQFLAESTVKLARSTVCQRGDRDLVQGNRAAGRRNPRELAGYRERVGANRFPNEPVNQLQAENERAAADLRSSIQQLILSAELENRGRRGAGKKAKGLNRIWRRSASRRATPGARPRRDGASRFRPSTGRTPERGKRCSLSGRGPTGDNLDAKPQGPAKHSWRPS